MVKCRMRKFEQTIPLSLYIHLPWCVKKCPYCDFNSHVAPLDLPQELYINALIKDLDAQLPAIWGRKISSIFFGGGTPSLFHADMIEKLLQQIHARLNYGPEIEITLEANPGTVDAANFVGFRAAGINRLSIGLQSLQNDKLKILGRIHDRNAAIEAIEIAKMAGFKNFNVDLMHGLPHQTVEDALADLKDALQFNPTHLSWYQLTIEPNTLFHHQPPDLPDEDILASIFVEGKKLLTQHGFLNYEVSAFSQPNKRSFHNMNYWTFGDYIGIGAGAHSKLTHVATGEVSRHWIVKHPKTYLDPHSSHIAETKLLSDQDLIFEFMLNALRLNDGFSLDLFTERTGLNAETVFSSLSLAEERKLISLENQIVKPTELGQQFLNDLVSIFLK